MASTGNRKLPLPHSATLIAWQAILADSITKMRLFSGPLSHVPLHQFPAKVYTSIWAEMTGGHGTYDVQFVLMDDEEEICWDCHLPEPLVLDNPRFPHELTLLNVVLNVPHPGHYRLIMKLNDVELVYRNLWIGPLEMFTS